MWRDGAEWCGVELCGVGAGAAEAAAAAPIEECCVEWLVWGTMVWCRVVWLYRGVNGAWSVAQCRVVLLVLCRCGKTGVRGIVKSFVCRVWGLMWLEVVSKVFDVRCSWCVVWCRVMWCRVVLFRMVMLVGSCVSDLGGVMWSGLNGVSGVLGFVWCRVVQYWCCASGACCIWCGVSGVLKVMQMVKLVQCRVVWCRPEWCRVVWLVWCTVVWNRRCRLVWCVVSNGLWCVVWCRVVWYVMWCRLCNVMWCRVVWCRVSSESDMVHSGVVKNSVAMWCNIMLLLQLVCFRCRCRLCGGDMYVVWCRVVLCRKSVVCGPVLSSAAMQSVACSRSSLHSCCIETIPLDATMR
ncbi:hypothetical protein DPMN_041654 [Dreissena polymorpha]|uniref:Uncharacterized protein n=1 Tax=Dreissena polymorpha TaxID=45954 RepID=A0A9D4CZ71_DREPO|nr:hypothetical protein DPMN_041654 [Dreissena polymorpha]